MVTDHGQMRLGEGSKYHVDLSEEFEMHGLNAFTNLDLHEFEKRTGMKSDVVFAPSGPRMAHIYAVRKKEEVFEALLEFESVEHVFFRKDGKVMVAYDGEISRLSDFEFGEEFPMARKRVEGLMKSERCGDFVIAAKRGYEFEKADHKGAHGGLYFEESAGFAVIHKPGIKEEKGNTDDYGSSARSSETSQFLA